LILSPATKAISYIIINFIFKRDFVLNLN